MFESLKEIPINNIVIINTHGGKNENCTVQIIWTHQDDQRTHKFILQH